MNLYVKLVVVIIIFVIIVIFCWLFVGTGRWSSLQNLVEQGWLAFDVWVLVYG